MLKTIQYSLAGFAMLYGAVSLAQAPIPEKINDWKNTYPLEYYSILAGADDIDDLQIRRIILIKNLNNLCGN
ncbi:hypothetical protein, partial [Parasutterella excrementihominis]|uniref:hypothetical protein n=1 Tax=Parasutterella excrementihominis TaxID=487175 RepID=UPI003FF0CF60